MPLLFFRNRCFDNKIKTLCFVVLSSLLFGCHQTPPEPTLDAMGYLDDEGSVRIWRKDLEDIPLVVKTDYQPYHKGHEVITIYRYIAGSLSEIHRQINANPEIVEELRFDDEKKLTFNQRILSDRKEMIEQTTIDNSMYQANDILQISSILRAGQVKLLQGVYQNEQVVTCQGSSETLNLARDQQNEMSKYQSQFNPLYIAWLQSPAGDELLLLTGKNICIDEPTVTSLN